MPITVDDLKETFPFLQPCTSHQILSDRDFIAMALSGIVTTPAYAAKLADIIIAHIRDDPYSAMRQHVTPFRAIVDLFFRHANDKDKNPGTYIRAVARAGNRIYRGAGAFRQFLVAASNQSCLRIPEELLLESGELFNTVIRARVNKAELKTIRAQAIAQGFVKADGTANLSAYMRYKLFE